MSERKPSKIDKVKWALYRTVTEATPAKMSTAKWVAYGTVGLCTMLIVGADKGGGDFPKWPKGFGD